MKVTAVETAGRTTAGFLSLYSDANEAAMPRLVSDTHSYYALDRRRQCSNLDLEHQHDQPEVACRSTSGAGSFRASARRCSSAE